MNKKYIELCLYDVVKVADKEYICAYNEYGNIVFSNETEIRYEDEIVGLELHIMAEGFGMDEHILEYEYDFNVISEFFI